MSQERVQKILAQAGITSRRKAEELILEGAVTINGQVAKLGDKAEFGKDAIKVSGKLLQTKEVPIYIAFNKPRGVVSTMNDPENRPCLATYLGKVKGRFFPIGRLDFNSDGLILLTNDGALAEKVQKATTLLRVYHVKVKGRPDAAKIARLEKGTRIGTRLIQPHSVRLAEELPSKVVLEVAFNDPGAIDVKALFESKGLLVDKITRTAIGHMTLRGMAPGEYRLLQASQMEAIVAQPELGMRRLETQGADDERNEEGGFDYRRPSRALEQKERRRQATAAASAADGDEASAPVKTKRAAARDDEDSHFDDSSDELPHTESPRSFDDAPARSMRRPSGIVVRKKGEGNSFGKPRGGFGSRGGFGKREGFGERGGFEKRPRFSGERDGFEKRPRFNGEGRGFEKRSGFEKRPSFGKRNSFGGEGRSFEKRGGFEKRPSFGGEGRGFEKRGGFEKRPSFGGEGRSFEKRGGFEKRPSFGGEGRSFEKRDGFEKRPSFGKRNSFGGEGRSLEKRSRSASTPRFGGQGRRFEKREDGFGKPEGSFEKRGGFGSRSGFEKREGGLSGRGGKPSFGRKTFGGGDRPSGGGFGRPSRGPRR